MGVFMYNLDFLEMIEYDELCNVVNSKELYPCVLENRLHVIYDSTDIFSMDVSDFSVSDLNNLLGLSLIDSKYAYYFIKYAYSNDPLIFKKKSLRL